MVMASRKLHPYFQTHQIEVLTNQPLRNIIHSPKASGRLIKWAIELGEFDVKYKPRMTIKAHALAYFVVECTILNQEVGGQEDTIPQDKEVDKGGKEKDDKEKEYWVLYFDGASKQIQVEQAEYEALIVGLGLAGTLRVKNLKVCGDSKLVISLVKGEFEGRDDTMAKYVRLVRAVMTQFDECHIEHIPREENAKADALSKFASFKIEESSGSVYFRVLKTRSIDVKLVAPIGLGTSWIDPIKTHIQTGWLPNDATEARKLAVRALRYSLIDGILYKRSFVVPYLRCLRPDEGQQPLFPRILGHEAEGVIESVGDGVTALKLGDKVLPLFTGECGECRHYKSSENNLCDLLRINLDRGVMLSDGKPRFSKDGKPIYHFVGTSTFSQYTVVHSGCVAKINPEAPLDKVCVFSCGISAGLYLTERTYPATQDLPLVEKGIAGFAIDFLMDGISAAVSKIVPAPIELVKLLIQNQDKCFSFSEEAK
ncbi:hypothetical protein AgCh_034288 [Apium graveolens]